MQKSVCVLFISVVLLAACSSNGPKLTEQQAKKVEMCKAELPASKKVKTQAVTNGCMMTMAISGIIGDNNPTPLLCMAGGASGLVFGESIAERKCTYITLEDQLNGEIAHTTKVNSGLNIVFAQQALDLQKFELSAAGLATQKATDEKSRESLAALEKSMSDQVAKDQALLKLTQDEFRFKSSTLKKSRSLEQKEKEEKLLEEIKALQKSIKTLQENNIKLIRVKNSLTLAQN